LFCLLGTHKGRPYCCDINVFHRSADTTAAAQHGRMAGWATSRLRAVALQRAGAKHFAELKFFAKLSFKKAEG